MFIKFQTTARVEIVCRKEFVQGICIPENGDAEILIGIGTASFKVTHAVAQAVEKALKAK